MTTGKSDERAHLQLPTTIPAGGSRGPITDDEMDFILEQPLVRWSVEYRLVRRVGSGGQGVVFLADRQGTGGLTVPVALKFFRRARFGSEEEYAEDMARVARTAARVALIQQDHLVDVHNFVLYEDTHVMSMEWVDGFDLRYLLHPARLWEIQGRVDSERWDYLNDVVLTSGPVQSRVKPGIAIAIVRECLAGLAALHRNGIVHGDIKPANIMLKRTGSTKIIDLGSSFATDEATSLQPFTVQYAAPEVLEGNRPTPYSDLASLGYVLVELLAGRPIFSDEKNYAKLIEARRNLVENLPELLPKEVLQSETLLKLIRMLAQPDPLKRFPSDEAADLLEFDAASFQRELVFGNLASEYGTEIRLWLEELDGGA